VGAIFAGFTLVFVLPPLENGLMFSAVLAKFIYFYI
jgi:hypothetical protein